MRFPYGEEDEGEQVRRVPSVKKDDREDDGRRQLHEKPPQSGIHAGS